MATLFNDIVDRIQNNYLLQAALNLKYTRANIDESVNNAHKRLCGEVRSVSPDRYVKEGVTVGVGGEIFGTVANTELYNLPTDYVAMKQLEYLVSGTVGAGDEHWVIMHKVDKNERWEYYGSYGGVITMLESPFVYYHHEVPALDGTAARRRVHQVGLAPIPRTTVANVIRPVYYYQVPILEYNVGAPGYAFDDELFLPDEDWDMFCMFEAMELLYIKDPSIFQNYNWKDDLRNYRERCFASLMPPNQMPDKIRQTY